MSCSGQDFRWMKIKNGRLHLAVVNLNIQKNLTGNEIIENYPKGAFYNNSIDIGINGFDDWKIALKKGLEFVVSYSQDFWTITINEVSGKPFMDTNPTIVGYTGILAFIEQTNLIVDNQIIKDVEEFVYSSWFNDNDKKIPNFNELTFKE